jgi:thiol:disulfide interchange protein/DsbC/DsbD-like thiol-disulfide interchange protein
MSIPCRGHRVPLSRLIYALQIALLWAIPRASQAFGPFVPEVPTAAVGHSPFYEGRARVTTRLLTDVATAPRGGSFVAGVLFDLDPGWHIYWLNSGDAGFPTELHWRSGDSLVGDVQWPGPQVFRESDGITTYGYQNRVLLPAHVTVSDSVGESLQLQVEVRYLACNVICSPGTVTLQRTLPVGPKAVPAEAEVLGLFAQANQAMPVAPQSQGVSVRAIYSQDKVRPGDMFRVALMIDGCSSATAVAQIKAAAAATEMAACPPSLSAPGQPYAPYTSAGLSIAATEVRAHPTLSHGLVVMLCGELLAPAKGAAPNPTQRLRGVLQLSRGGALLPPLHLDLDFPLGKPGQAVTLSKDALFAAVAPPHRPTPQLAVAAHAAPTAAPTGLLQALLLALLGGLVLNVMPCVLPVLAIKVIGMTQHGNSSKRAIALHGLAYTAGVVASMLALGCVVLGLKAVGTTVGWGFQFQEPRFVAVVSCVLVLFALNCFGVFEISTGAGGLGDAVAQAHGLRRSGLDGVLAVVLATPCSAPFLGTAVAYAFTAVWWVNLAIFVAIGLGLALPYVALTLLPGAMRLVPRPGPWMNHVKHLLGFGLLATVVWLVWIVGRFSGVDSVARLLLVLLLGALGAYIFGIVSQRQPQRQGLWAIALLAAWVAAFVASPTFAPTPPQMAQATAGVQGQSFAPWSDAAVQAALKKGQPVFVDFGADWCITCKYNEQHVLGDPAVVQAFSAANVALLHADWTRRDATILKVLTSFGHAGVPLYLLYNPQQPQGAPKVLPEILTQAKMLEALAELQPHKPAEGL